MDLKTVVAAVPVLRRLWVWLPGPLKFVALVGAVFFWLRGRGEPGPPEADAAADAPERLEPDTTSGQEGA